MKYKFIILFLWTTLFFFFYFFFFFFSSNSTLTPMKSSIEQSACPTNIARFYVYDLPERFNDRLLRRCKWISVSTNMCPYVTNRGLGRPITSILPMDRARNLTDGNWYATNQFVGEMIFHARVEDHPCRTLNPSEAELFYAPFYMGLYASSVFRLSNLEERDRLAVDFVQYLVQQKQWKRHFGGDHFLVAGRIARDFMRSEKATRHNYGANKLFRMIEVQNVTLLTVERNPWNGRNQFGIPYPSYFHPKNAEEVSTWQDKVNRVNRTHLFSFVGGPRKGSVREEIFRQCTQSTRCLVYKCKSRSGQCYEPGQVLGIMLRSEFCMQPPGDSFTRRSVFDSILAGCIPVFFSEHTAFTQYQWYLPVTTDEYSVFIPKARWGNIEEELIKIPKERVESIRRRVIKLIPTLTYAHPNSTASGGPGFFDAVDVALAGLTSHVRAKLLTNNIM